MAPVYVGNRRKFTFTITNAAGLRVDPTVVTFEVTEPDGIVTSYVYGTDVEVTRAGAGVYYAEVTLDAPGDWEFWWFSTGNYICSDTVMLTARGHVLT